VTFLDSAFNAGLDQAQDTDPSYWQGAEGYGRRFGAEYTGQASSRFFKEFAYPWIFSEDPRYYRLAHGNAGRRLLHAVEHSVVAHRDDGARMFNFSEWLGTTSTVVLEQYLSPGQRTRLRSRGAASGLQHPPRHGFRHAARILARDFQETQTALPR